MSAAGYPDPRGFVDDRFELAGPYSWKLRCRLCGATGYATNRPNSWMYTHRRKHLPCPECNKSLVVYPNGLPRKHPRCSGKKKKEMVSFTNRVLVEFERIAGEHNYLVVQTLLGNDSGRLMAQLPGVPVMTVAIMHYQLVTDNNLIRFNRDPASRSFADFDDDALNAALQRWTQLLEQGPEVPEAKNEYAWREPSKSRSASGECSCHREAGNHEACCGHEEGRDPDCPFHGDGSHS